jgi:hypothetical protein
MIELRVTFETAKLAQEKEFKEFDNCTHFYSPDGILMSNDYKFSKFGCLAPRQEVLKQWLREKYHLYVRVAVNSISTYFPMIELAEVGGTQMKGPAYDKNYRTYEAALEVGLREALKLIEIPK